MVMNIRDGMLDDLIGNAKTQDDLFGSGGVIKELSRPSRRKFDGDKGAQLVALCCSKPPKGRSDWTIRLLADKVVEMEIVDSVSGQCTS
jgi:hypothetical protein